MALIFISMSLECYSQKAQYGYDAAGNRISKTIPFQQKSARISSPESPDVPMKEMIKDNSIPSREIRIYPNPTQGRIEIEIPDNPGNPGLVQITLLDINGRKVFDKKQEPVRTIIDLSNQPDGIYFLNLIKGSVVSQWKIIKQ
jgi:hypothetical protein